MTSAQTMLSRLGAALALGLTALGCSSPPELTPPSALTAPYDTAHGDVLWAVVPLRNESGTKTVDSLAVSDKVVAAAAQVRGVQALPLNRTLDAMRALNMPDVLTPEDARRLATEMGADGLLLGSITAYDPYNPPIIGLSLALYARPGMLSKRRPDVLDTRELQARAAEIDPVPRSGFPESPASIVSVHLDGKNHQVLMDLQHYAEGRSERVSALGWKRYLASMDLYSEFAAWHTLGELLDREWVRLARATDRQSSR